MTKILYPSLSQSLNEQNALSKAHTDNLIIRLHELEKDLQHYRKLKRKLNIF